MRRERSDSTRAFKLDPTTIILGRRMIRYPSLLKPNMTTVFGALMIVLAAFVPFGPLMFVLGWIALLENRDRRALMLGVACTLLAAVAFVFNHAITSIVVTDGCGS